MRWTELTRIFWSAAIPRLRPAVAGLAFYVSWLLATASLRPDFHYIESVRIGAAGTCG